MALRIEDYAMIGDCRTAALVGRDGSIDWLCVPRFDSGACFAALLGGPENGRWKLAPNPRAGTGGEVRTVRRAYRQGSLVLETEFQTDSGAVRVTDALAIDSPTPTVVRVVEGLRGRVPVRSELVIRFDYGSAVPWVRRSDGGVAAIAGPDMLRFQTDAGHRGEDMATVSEFDVSEGERFRFTLAWHPSYEPPPAGVDACVAVETADRWWRDWSGRCEGEECEDDPDGVVRSLITLKGLTYAPTGGIVAAPTTSLPEWIGGVRNWDYRHCWLRDATFTLLAFVNAGYLNEARAWRDWLLRATAGSPESLQIMYGVAGERRLPEWEIPWLKGYEGSAPVRSGNAASLQFQLDVYGEIADAMSQAHVHGLTTIDDAWQFTKLMMEHLETVWREPDEGIWEVRGPRRHFTHSKVMAWVAFDRAVKVIERYGRVSARANRWRAGRDAVHAEVCQAGFDAGLNSFVQSYGSKRLDASVLVMPMVGFLPATDSRVAGTIAAVQANLMRDGFVARYQSEGDVDGLPPGEGMFLPCTTWLADALALQGRQAEARELFDRLLSVRNDVGLLAEEYDPIAGRLLGNFPQAFSHVGVINTARILAGTAKSRAD